MTNKCECHIELRPLDVLRERRVELARQRDDYILELANSDNELHKLNVVDFAESVQDNIKKVSSMIEELEYEEKVATRRTKEDSGWLSSMLKH